MADSKSAIGSQHSVDNEVTTPTPSTHALPPFPNAAPVKKDHGITLIPHPSDDPRDPLNWSMGKKVAIVAVLSLSTFAGLAGSLSGQLQVKPQASLYGVSTTEIAWQGSVANAGMILGGFVWFPVSHIIGRSSAIFWSLLGSMLCNVWSAIMTNPDDYVSWIMSRVMAGFFGTVAGVLGPRMLVDLFFLHQRGRAFNVFHFWFDFGTVAGPTIGGLIAAKSKWPNAYWFTTGLSGAALLAVFIFLHETSWNRAPGASNNSPPASFVANRIATFFPGTRVTPKSSASQIAKVAITPFIIGVTPVTLILGFFTLINFGFYVAMNAITPVWLQKPVKLHGYGFTAWHNAQFSLFHWLGIVLALTYGQLVSDRLPLWICARNGGIWKPEYRLHALWVPALLLNPIGLGIFAAGLQYHLGWGVLALGQVMVTFGSLSTTPITVNYICECFTHNPAETAIILNTFRIGFGLSIAFYINQWVDAVGFGWAYGMMSFFQAFSFLFVILLMWKGHQIRAWTIGSLGSSEEGEKLVGEGGSDVEKSVA